MFRCVSESDQYGGCNFIKINFKISTQASLGIYVIQKARMQRVPLVDKLFILSYAECAAELFSSHCSI